MAETAPSWVTSPPPSSDWPILSIKDQGTPEWRSAEIQGELSKAPTPEARAMLEGELAKQKAAEPPAWVKRAKIPGGPEAGPPAAVRPPSSLAEAFKDTALETGRNLATVAEMVLSTPVMGMQMGKAIQLGIQGVVAGKARSATDAEIEAETRRINQTYSPTFLTDLLNKLSPTPETPSAAQQALGKADSLIQDFAQMWEDRSHGVVRKQDVVSVVNSVMFGAAAKATAYGTGKMMERKPEAPAEPPKGPLPLEPAAVERTREAMAQTAKDVAKPPVAKAEEAPTDSLERLWQEVAKATTVAGVGAGLTLAFPDEKRDDVVLGAMGAGLILSGDMRKLAAKPEGSALGVMLEGEHSTIKVFEFPEFQNRTSFRKSELLEASRRQGVTKVEQGIVQQVVDSVPGDTISAKRAVLGWKEATGDFELKAADSKEYAGYGLENIGRAEEDFVEGEFAHPQVPGSRTTVWQSPLETGRNNHFNDPNYFAHTRAFEEDGVPHVVEIQSDLVQKAGKVLSEEEHAKLKDEYNKLMDERLEQLRIYNTSPRGSAEHSLAGQKLARMDVETSELRSKLAAGKDVVALRPMFKDWYKRIVREELARAVRDSAGEMGELREALRDAAERPREFRESDVAGWKARLADLEKGGRVRFATADTVAKVEGWPEAVGNAARMTRDRIQTLERDIRLAQTSSRPRLQYGETTEQAISRWRAELEQQKEHLRLIEAETASYAGSRFEPQYQGIYDRYRGDIEKFLRGLGGKDYKDPHGHTWIEVPTQPLSKGGGRAMQFGGADIKHLVGWGLLTGGAVVGMNLDPKDKIQGAILGAIGGVSLMAAPSVVRGVVSKVRGATPRISISGLADKLEGDIATSVARLSALANNLLKEVPKAESRERIYSWIKDHSTPLSPEELATAKKVQRIFDAFEAEGKKDKVVRDYRSFETNDVVAALSAYAGQVIRAAANKRFVNALKTETDPVTKKSFAMPTKEAPKDYQPVKGLPGFSVHPDIAAAVEFSLDTGTLSGLAKSIESVNALSKMSHVAFSAFHAVALIEGQLGARGFTRTLVGLARLAIGKDALLNQLRREGSGELIDKGLRNGLKVSVSRGEIVSDIRGDTMVEVLRDLGNFMDKRAPGSGIAFKGLATAQHAFDVAMWERLQAAGKLNIFAESYRMLRENNIKAHEKNPGKVALLSDDEVAKQAAGFANDVQGGLAWRMIAEGLQKAIGTDWGFKAFSPMGRMVLRVAFFAPDWLLATTRTLFKAFGKGSGVKGLFKPRTSADLYRRYQLRSMVYYLLIADAVQHHRTGRHIWENTDLFKVWWDDNSYIRIAKHVTDPYELLQTKGMSLTGKLGAFPNLAIQEGRQLATRGEMTMKPVKEMFQPFSTTSSAGAFGFPMYGLGPEEKAEYKKQFSEDAKRRRELMEEKKKHFWTEP